MKRPAQVDAQGSDGHEKCTNAQSIFLVFVLFMVNASPIVVCSVDERPAGEREPSSSFVGISPTKHARRNPILHDGLTACSAVLEESLINQYVRAAESTDCRERCSVFSRPKAAVDKVSLLSRCISVSMHLNRLICIGGERKMNLPKTGVVIHPPFPLLLRKTDHMRNFFLIIIAVALSISFVQAQTVLKDVPYSESALERQVLDLYAPAEAKDLPVVFWIHGGGWTGGDKSKVQLKPQAFMDRGFVFVSTNYRLLPDVEMETIFHDVAKSLGWVHHHIGEHGGDPNRIFVMGHSAGAQLAALMCTDERYLKAEGVPFSVLRGCVPVDGDTYDVPAIIETAETRCRVHHLPQAKFGHREKFGNDAAKHLDFSVVTHISRDKGIPPFLVLYVDSHPDTRAQALRLEAVLKKADIPTLLWGGRETNHTKLNDDLGLPDDSATMTLFHFVDEALKK